MEIANSFEISLLATSPLINFPSKTIGYAYSQENHCLELQKMTKDIKMEMMAFTTNH